VNGAGATLGNAAAVLGAGQADIRPDRPKQRRVGIDVDIMIFAIDIEANHSRTSPGEFFRSAHLKTGPLNADAQTVIRLFQINNRAGGLFRPRSSRVDGVLQSCRLRIVVSRVQLFDDIAVQQ
jgi:hypothetical protein